MFVPEAIFIQVSYPIQFRLVNNVPTPWRFIHTCQRTTKPRVDVSQADIRTYVNPVRKYHSAQVSSLSKHILPDIYPLHDLHLRKPSNSSRAYGHPFRRYRKSFPRPANRTKIPSVVSGGSLIEAKKLKKSDTSGSLSAPGAINKNGVVRKIRLNCS